MDARQTHIIETGAELGAAGYALHHAAKGTPIGQEGGPVQTVGRVVGNYFLIALLTKFLLIPYLCITLFIFELPAIFVWMITGGKGFDTFGENGSANPVVVVLLILCGIAWIWFIGRKLLSAVLGFGRAMTGRPLPPLKEPKRVKSNVLTDTWGNPVN